MESLDYEGRTKAWYRKKSVWLIVGPLFISFAFTLAVSAVRPAPAWQPQQQQQQQLASRGVRQRSAAPQPSPHWLAAHAC